jgi:hypothetical protein
LAKRDTGEETNLYLANKSYWPFVGVIIIDYIL